jgi:hypothetical protein
MWKEAAEVYFDVTSGIRQDELKTTYFKKVICSANLNHVSNEYETRG